MTDRLPDKLESNGRVEVRVDGTVVGTRRIIDFVTSGGWSGVDDKGVDDKVTLTVSGGGDTLWESVDVGAGVMQLEPITPPDNFVVTANDFVDIIAGGASGAILEATTSGNVSLLTSTGNIYATSGGKVTISGAGVVAISTTGGADITVHSDDDLAITVDDALSSTSTTTSLASTGDFGVSSSAGDVTLTANSGILLQQADTVTIHGGDTTTVDAAGSYLKLGAEDTAVPTILAGDRLIIEARSSAPADADLQGWFATGNNIEAISFWVDEAGNKLKVKVLYQNGTTFKTGEIALT